ncbi:polysaccharide pyruvyl transferase family protein [uncultured Eubacterium sp.]|uniref:polysaccharide pyruvyl transferase family protein n=1 Tax=uncultured Eubacterium sp. TaxID=165185 RepID=UPI0026722EE3|nr:polysaccharide pyruvyl transferase family protein [uncultured Eubacterium sp.]
MRDVFIGITAASYSGNKGAAAMLQSSIKQLHNIYGDRLNINLMSVYPGEDKKQLPFDFINITSTKPEQLLFIAFPLAVLYKLFKWCPPIKKLIAKNKIIKTYLNTDLVVDEAGISFVDSRGFVMNTYAFVCAAVPLLVGTPVVKYSQALGTFKNPYNRFLAKWILPKLKLICARGQGTYDNLMGIGIKDNVKLCADGAFSMEDSEYWNAEINKICGEDSFYNENVVGLSISSVVEKKCAKMGIAYKDTMVSFVNYLNESGYHVILIANAARINSEKSRNNDLLVGDAIYNDIADKTKVRWYHKEMDAEEIRAYIGKCRYLVASRFHAMIGSLEQKVPVLLIGWSHKYQEVLDMFELGQYAIDFSKLELSELKESFRNFISNEKDIRAKLDKNLDKVLESSKNNIKYISEIIDEIIEKPYKKSKLLDLKNPDKYIGSHIGCKKGYATDEAIRANAASGGMVTALLCNMLKNREIDGAWVTKTAFENGELTYKTYVATTKEEICDASSSVYMNIPLLKHIDVIKNFDGKVAVVMTPCMLRGLDAIFSRDEELKNKVVLKLGLYCSGNHSPKATTLSMEKSGITGENAKRLYYRRGHWRGTSSVIYDDDSAKEFSYSKTICAYKNAYFFEKDSCMSCQDHYAACSDISFGDIWLKEMKGNPIKHTSCVIRSQKAYDMINQAISDGDIMATHISDRDMVRSQKRALVFKFNLASAKSKHTKIKMDTSDKCKWNHKLALKLAEHNKKFSEEHYDKLAKIPTKIIYYYMCFIRVLLSF